MTMTSVIVQQSNVAFPHKYRSHDNRKVTNVKINTVNLMGTWFSSSLEKDKDPAIKTILLKNVIYPVGSQVL